MTVAVAALSTASGAKTEGLIRICNDEHERRVRCGLGALGRITINGLFSLPYGYWVRWDDLGTGLAKSLRDGPDGVVERSAHGVRRWAVPPVTVELAVVTGLSWGPGLSTAGAFAPFCRRVLLLDQHRRVPKSKLWEADYWGIGVWQHTTDGVEELVAPAPWRQRYANPAGWAFRERAYDAWLGATGRRPPGGPPDLFGPGITSASREPLTDGLPPWFAATSEQW